MRRPVVFQKSVVNPKWKPRNDVRVSSVFTVEKRQTLIWQSFHQVKSIFLCSSISQICLKGFTTPSVPGPLLRIQQTSPKKCKGWKKWKKPQEQKLRRNLSPRTDSQEIDVAYRIESIGQWYRKSQHWNISWTELLRHDIFYCTIITVQTEHMHTSLISHVCTGMHLHHCDF